MKRSISIEPYFDPEVPNMGFERYGMSTAPGSETTEYISKDVNGRYVTGIDIDSPSIIYMEDDKERASTIEDITKVVNKLERVFGSGELNAKNEKMWGGFYIKLTHTGKDLNPQDPKDEILIRAIKAGGFSTIAPSLDVAKADGSYKYYLHQIEIDADLKVERKRVVAKAKGELSKLDAEDSHKMRLVAKCLLSPTNEFRPSTPQGIIFDKLDQFIEGTIVKENKKNTVKQFLDACKLDKKTLTLTSLVKDAIYFFVLTRENDGYFYNKETESKVGKTEKDIIKYLDDPTNQSEIENIKKRVSDKLQ